jgi:hypothetical protein
MVNIHEILKGYGIEIPEEKKADFDKTVTENYKTIVEVDKLKDKLEQSEKREKETKETLDSTNKAFEDLKKSNASKEDWEKKYNDLVADHRAKEEEQARLDIEKQERAEFDAYFTENKKEWANPYIADGYFNQYKAAKALEENKGKTTADICHNITKDDATAFKTVQPVVTLKGAATGLGGSSADVKSLPTIF